MKLRLHPLALLATLLASSATVAATGLMDNPGLTEDGVAGKPHSTQPTPLSNGSSVAPSAPSYPPPALQEDFSAANTLSTPANTTAVQTPAGDPFAPVIIDLSQVSQVNKVDVLAPLIGSFKYIGWSGTQIMTQGGKKENGEIVPRVVNRHGLIMEGNDIIVEVMKGSDSAGDKFWTKKAPSNDEEKQRYAVALLGAENEWDKIHNTSVFHGNNDPSVIDIVVLPGNPEDYDVRYSNLLEISNIVASNNHSGLITLVRKETGLRVLIANADHLCFTDNPTAATVKGLNHGGITRTREGGDTIMDISGAVDAIQTVVSIQAVTDELDRSSTPEQIQVRAYEQSPGAVKKLNDWRDTNHHGLREDLGALRRRLLEDKFGDGWQPQALSSPGTYALPPRTSP